ncbi:MAG: UDP-N-acetylmuramate dehydrogenase [Candidatus Coprenecus sp.]
MKIYRNCSLLPYNTFGVDGRCSALVEYDTEQELCDIMELVRNGELPLPLMQIGQGSNILFTRDFPGTLLHGRICGIQVLNSSDKEVWVKAGAGVVWDDFVSQCVENGWYGAENLSLIPGLTGSAAVQNIGAYGTEVKDIISSVRCLDIDDGVFKTFDINECGYGYRDSLFKKRRSLTVTSVTFKLSTVKCFNLSYSALQQAVLAQGADTLSQIREIVCSIRRSKLPDVSTLGSAGSFFKNPLVERSFFESLKQKWPDIPGFGDASGNGPVKLSAGWLIEKCGWKGKSLGRAGVYQKQALVLVNLSGATGEEIAALSRLVADDVFEKFGVSLSPEVLIL